MGGDLNYSKFVEQGEQRITQSTHGEGLQLAQHHPARCGGYEVNVA